MPDSTLNAIDRFFDIVDGGVEKLDHVLNRGKRTEEQHRARRAKRSEIIDAQEVSKAPKVPKAKECASAPTTTSITRKPHFYIIESITPSGTLFVVTDGDKARTECATREFAEKILRALEASP